MGRGSARHHRVFPPGKLVCQTRWLILYAGEYPVGEWTIFNAIGAINDTSPTSAAPKVMQSDFRRTVQAHGNDARSCTHRSVSAHAVIMPSARPHSSRQYRLQLDRNRSRKTKLATVCMAGQH